MLKGIANKIIKIILDRFIAIVEEVLQADINNDGKIGNS